MPDSLHIRAAVIDDSESVAALAKQLGYQTTVEKTRLLLTDILKNNNYRVFIAVTENKTVGWIQGFYAIPLESGPFMEITGMVVDSSFRRMGIGKKLIRKIEEWAQEKNCTKIRVRCNVKRTETHRFYSVLGFTETKEQKIFDKKI